MAGKRPSKGFVPLEFGPLPTDIIRATLGLELAPGVVRLSINAQRHAARRHPNDYGRCLPHVASVVAQPAYIGDDFRNPGKVELIRRIPVLGQHLLVAVTVESDADGAYNVTSFYPVSQVRIDGRREKGHLRIAGT